MLDERPDHPEALLIAGLAQTAEAQPEGADRLRRFLDVAADDHPGRALANAALAAEQEPDP